MRKELQEPLELYRWLAKDGWVFGDERPRLLTLQIQQHSPITKYSCVVT